jgi:fatty acid desaturase
LTIIQPAAASTRDAGPETRGSDYAALSRRVRSAGLLDRRIGSYTLRLVATLGFYAAVWAAVAWLGDSWFQCVTAVALAVAYTQVAFLGHDAGHQQILTTRRTNDLLGRIAADLLLGLGYGWWIDKHNRHHANPNKEGCDPDIGDGVLAFTTGQAAARTGRLGRAILRHQAWLFFPLLTLEGLNLHAASLLALRTRGRRSTRGGHRGLELLLLSVNLGAYLGVLVVVMSPTMVVLFVVIHQGVWGLYMGCSFAPNHKGMPIVAPGRNLDHLRRQVLTSRNVRGGWFVDLLLGGLNYQVEHHLFPSMPRTCLRAAQPIVRAHCAALGIPYTETSLLGSYAIALRHLNSIGAPARIRPASPADIARPSRSTPGRRSPCSTQKTSETGADSRSSTRTAPRSVHSKQSTSTPQPTSPPSSR